ncbi:MAG TPA: alginate export family protein, partial [Candidatus Hydrogenedentes bacterium]|nr:alginate export family protein [Candidatus Hydrogenedentota bacterium]
MRLLICTLVACALLGTAYADLQNVQVYGRIDIRARYYRNSFNNAAVLGGGPALETRIPAFLLPGRATGQAAGVAGLFDYDHARSDWSFTELVTTLGVKADFTNNVNAVIEFYDFAWWGEDFRSDYITGADSRATTSDDVELLQSYIEMNEVGGLPLRLRIGRQRLRYDEGWLLSDRATPTLRIAWDGVLVTYATDQFEVDAFATKLAENSPFEQDGDIDFYGIRAAYTALENVDFAAWWYWVRDARSFSDTNLTWFGEWMENWFGVDDYDPTNLHTVGGRVWGNWGALDYDLKL